MSGRVRRTFFLASLAALVSAWMLAPSHDAYALGPFDAEVTLRLGYGTDPFNPSGSSSPNGLGVAFGARAGASIQAVYVGLRFDDYLGGRSTFANPMSMGGMGGSGTLSTSVHTLIYGLDVGYNLHPLPILTIRPVVSVGNADLSTTGLDTNVLYVGGGVTALLTFGSFVVGADAALIDFPTASNSQVSFVFGGQAGVRF